MSTSKADAVVIGSGPGGYVAGIRLGQLGVDTVVVEREEPGGVCLNVGCIPSKALIHAAKTYEKMSKSGGMGIVFEAPPTIDVGKLQTWKAGVVKKLTRGVQQLLKANGARLIRGVARIEAGEPDAEGRHVVVVEGDGEEQRIAAEHVVVATGSRPIEIPGFAIDQERVIDSTGALALSEIPERLVVIGGGYIGLEIGTVYAKLGGKVTVVEALDTVLAGMDPDCVQTVARKLRKAKIQVHLGATAKSWEERGDHAVVTVAQKSGEEIAIDADKILLSVGRRPNSEGLGLEDLGVAIDERGFVKVDSRLCTNVPGIYAIGDVAGGVMLAHKASKEAEVVAEVIKGSNEEMDVRAIPAVVFTDPEIASAGLGEQEAREGGREIRVGKFPLAASGRALSAGDTDGLVKVIADAETEEVLGVHIAGNGASELIAEAVLGIEMGAVLRDFSLTIHAHPTLAEATREAAAAALGEAIHIVNR